MYLNTFANPPAQVTSAGLLSSSTTIALGGRSWKLQTLYKDFSHPLRTHGKVESVSDA